MKLKLFICLFVLVLASCSAIEKLNDEVDIVKEEITENNPITNEEQEEINTPEVTEEPIVEEQVPTEPVVPEESLTEEEASTPDTNEKTVVPNTSTDTEQNTEQTPNTETEPPSTNSEASYLDQVEQAIFTLVNQEREKAGVSALSYSQTMQKYARIKSQDMAVKGYFDHKDPQGNLITDQMAAVGVTYQAWGENIAYIGGQTDPTVLANQFMVNWMNSSGHRENILSTNFTEIGVGVYQTGNTVYATQEFYR